MFIFRVFVYPSQAAGRAKPKVIELLIANHADIMAKNNDGLRPQDIATDPRVIELLTPESLIGLWTLLPHGMH